MRFEDFYEDLITERNYGDDKFDVVSSKMSNWLLDEFGSTPISVVRMPMYSEFKKYLIDKGITADNEEDVILGFVNLEEWLNQLDSRLSQKFLTLVGQRYPDIQRKIKFWDKPDGYTPGKRGRQPGSKNKPRIDIDDISISPVATMNIEPQVDDNISTEPKRRGRKPSEDSLRKLETQYEKMQDDLEVYVRKMRDLMKQINQRRSYFGKNE